MFQALDLEGKMGQVGLDLHRPAGGKRTEFDQLRASRRLHENQFRSAGRFVTAKFGQAQNVPVKFNGLFQIIDPVAGVQKFANFHDGRIIRFGKMSNDKTPMTKYIRAMRRFGVLLLVVAAWLFNRAAFGQIDPENRELIEMGGNQALVGAAPIDGYGYYYLNEPNFFATNVTLRLAFAGVYLDTEAGFVGLLGPNTDLGLGFAGGGFADSYFEFHDGKYLPDESFFGHSVEGSASIYHLFNPGSRVPLIGVLRIKEHYSIYETDDDTSSAFTLPSDHSTVSVRTGLRLGGRAPLLHPDLAMELSVWYEGQYRTDAGSYGYDGDRDLNETSQLFWGRGLLIYTFPKSTQRIELNLTAGGSDQADRFSAYRMGGDMPLTSEFPLMIPGYFDGELSARNFACFNAQYALPLDASKRWSLNPIGSIATVDYVPGMAQPSHFNSGAGIGLGYHSRSGVWDAVASYGYGFEAIRSNGRGGQSIGFLLQINLEGRHPGTPSGLDDFRNVLQHQIFGP
jgi:hypothetical protein